MPQFFKRSIFTLFFLGMTFRMMAQEQLYFVYIQSERSQPFYVRYDGKLIPSSDRGYLILSKMPAGTASLRIGFAKSDVPERQYLVRVTGPADQGYLLKQDAGRGYALFNLQTFAVIRPGEERKKEAVAVAETPAVTTPPAEEAPAQDTATAPVVAANSPETTPAPAPVPASADSALVPAPPVAVSEEQQKQAMMASLKKDLDSTFPAKSGVTVGPGTRPVKQSNKFSQALDKVVSDDRPDDIQPEEPKAPVAAAVEAVAPTVAPATDATEAPKKRRRRREREPLTDEEKQLASAVLAEENKSAEAAPAKEQPITEATPAVVPPATEPAPPATKPATETASASSEAAPVVVAEPVKEEAPALTKKEKRQRKKKSDDPAFIDFLDTGGHQAPPAGSVAAPATPATAPATGDTSVETSTPAEEVPASPKKKKRSKLAEKIDTIDTSEHPNNVVNDPTGYEVSDLSIDHPKESKKDKKKKKEAEGENVDVAAPVATEATPAPKSSSLKMINSDCGKVMDDDTFRKMLRKFVAGKDDDGMLDAFRKQTKGYCLESAQIKTLVQLMSTDDSRYRLLDLAYPKAYHSDEYAGLESLLSDSYYKGRFRAMLHR
ncbi:DUF4476 domain-containing protein [Chitinophaga ginsengisoli]|uniref:Uncharacterized protein DUF4476 n=1 Tax=Chitinophaga ginsengisoli TaxID=363837 RepID=A0A2P8FCW3_9BACT|nr:DUF4476 domain-containing protein [Chitinophaga ginsengisoli]PSL19538.1 uncharacterized protein DUF4476 [Chitinophaga ginsengisoli]